MAARRIDRNLAPKVREILQHADAYHQRYYASETFGGPSIHFHRRALGMEEKVSDGERLELIYAVLVSWGMHRMGRGGPKMQEFTTFKESVASIKEPINTLRPVLPGKLSPSDWPMLEKVFKGIKVMDSGTTIVGNSKVMAHLLPNLVAPVDRQYTLKFLFGRKEIQNGLEREWKLMRKIHEQFYYSIANDTGFQRKAQAWMIKDSQFPWDTSILKVIDNLVIGSMRS